jgi:endogenous inhibitor of DNA gyrase (YacG/DUF329 family)
MRLHEGGTGRVASALLGAPDHRHDLARWDLGTCTNCDAPVPVASKPQTFCSDECRRTATQIRDLRRRRASGEAVELSGDLDHLTADARHRVLSAVPLRGCDAEDWATFIRWFQDADQI